MKKSEGKSEGTGFPVLSDVPAGRTPILLPPDESLFTQSANGGWVYD